MTEAWLILMIKPLDTLYFQQGFKKYIRPKDYISMWKFTTSKRNWMPVNKTKHVGLSQIWLDFLLQFINQWKKEKERQQSVIWRRKYSH